ncbi:MAG: hypothetical protein JWR84_958 [Caulobacter sp.]|nr:hypothetical protein [Caulobacter sp.]
MRFWVMLAVAAAMAFPAAAADWTVLRQPGFKADMPGTAVVSTIPPAPGIVEPAQTWTVDEGTWGVALTVMKLDPEVAKLVDPLVIVNAGLDGAIAQIGATETSRRDTTVKGGGSAREVRFTFEDGGVKFNGRAVAVMLGARVYCFLGMTPATATPAQVADIDRAINSLELTPQ